MLFRWEHIDVELKSCYLAFAQNEMLNWPFETFLRMTIGHVLKGAYFGSAPQFTSLLCVVFPFISSPQAVTVWRLEQYNFQILGNIQDPMCVSQRNL